MQKETVPFKDGLSFYTTKERRDNSPLFMVEVTGLEPTTSWSLTKRATKLRYTSNKLNCRGNGRYTTSWSSSSRSAALLHCTAVQCSQCALRSSSSQKSRFAAIFGSPVRCALPNCATPRSQLIYYSKVKFLCQSIVFEFDRIFYNLSFYLKSRLLHLTGIFVHAIMVRTAHER